MKHQRCLTCWAVRASLVGVIFMYCLPAAVVLTMVGVDVGWPWQPVIVFFIGAAMLTIGVIIAATHVDKRL